LPYNFYLSISHRELVITPFDFVVLINGSHQVLRLVICAGLQV
jgi:hypothetical protein